MEMSQEQFCGTFTGKMPDPYSGEGKKRTWRCHKSHFVWTFTGKMPDVYSGNGILYGIDRKNALGDVTRAILRGHLQEKCRTVFRGRKRTWRCHWTFTGKMPDPYSGGRKKLIFRGRCHKSHFAWTFTGKMPDPYSGVFVRKLTRKNAHGDVTGAILWKFTGKRPDPKPPTSIKHRTFYTYRKNPFSVATVVWGIKNRNRKVLE